MCEVVAKRRRLSHVDSGHVVMYASAISVRRLWASTGTFTAQLRYASYVSELKWCLLLRGRDPECGC